MLKAIRRARARPTPSLEREPLIPARRRCYAIGDIHGRLDLLVDLLRRIRADSRTVDSESVHVVFLGDFIDRGPQSREVIDLLLHGDWSWARPVFLRGNHEEAFEGALAGDLSVLRRWVAFGGLDTCSSYGLGGAAWAEGQPERFRERLRRLIPIEHVRFLNDLYDSFMVGDYMFVHAGVRPGVPLDAQNPVDLHWIREDFLSADCDFGKMIVHGHTVSHIPEVRFNRIGIDTGAYKSGTLTALVIDGGAADGSTKGSRWFLSTGDTADHAIKPQLAPVRADN